MLIDSRLAVIQNSAIGNIVDCSIVLPRPLGKLVELRLLLTNEEWATQGDLGLKGSNLLNLSLSNYMVKWKLLWGGIQKWRAFSWWKVCFCFPPSTSVEVVYLTYIVVLGFATYPEFIYSRIHLHPWPFSPLYPWPFFPYIEMSSILKPDSDAEPLKLHLNTSQTQTRQRL